ncbi:MAG TPA: dTDP-4-dehydrorhamnose 3,5-epimerase [Blastocatellia bacterium]|nr:dTDP-4-dehydrorhamnose 3,5-epimerase [Blastocatellia bacterium]
MIEFSPLDIPDILVLQPKVFADDRGLFVETYQADRFAEIGISDKFVQDNYSRSCRGALRGLHYQIQQAQGKLIWVVRGEVFDVAVDLRRSSPTFGKWVGANLSAENRLQLWIPKGFAHGFYVLSEVAEVVYKVTDFYAPQNERTLLWNDATVGVKWPLSSTLPILSAKDAAGMTLAAADLFE